MKQLMKPRILKVFNLEVWYKFVFLLIFIIVNTSTAVEGKRYSFRLDIVNSNQSSR